jgi:hypothetical protein
MPCLLAVGCDSEEKSLAFALENAWNTRLTLDFEEI